MWRMAVIILKGLPFCLVWFYYFCHLTECKKNETYLFLKCLKFIVSCQTINFPSLLVLIENCFEMFLMGISRFYFCGVEIICLKENTTTDVYPSIHHLFFSLHLNKSIYQKWNPMLVFNILLVLNCILYWLTSIYFFYDLFVCAKK